MAATCSCRSSQTQASATTTAKPPGRTSKRRPGSPRCARPYAAPRRCCMPRPSTSPSWSTRLANGMSGMTAPCCSTKAFQTARSSASTTPSTRCNCGPRSWQRLPSDLANGRGQRGAANEQSAIEDRSTAHANNSLTTRAFSTPVNFMSSPWKGTDKRSWSMPSKRSIVACRSRTCTTSSTAP